MTPDPHPPGVLRAKIEEQFARFRTAERSHDAAMVSRCLEETRMSTGTGGRKIGQKITANDPASANALLASLGLTQMPELGPRVNVARPARLGNKYALCSCGSREPYANCCGRKR